jgi:hypothetical protein
MYTKLYRGIVDGSLYGRREALTVFFVMLALADQEGIVDVLPQKIADILGETEDFVNIGLAELSAPDPMSRTPTAEGRRILLLNEHRSWGWKITNYAAYRKIRDEEQRREYQRQWDRDNRKRPVINPTASDTIRQHPTQSDKSDHVRPNPTYTEAEAEADTLLVCKSDTSALTRKKFIKPNLSEVSDYCRSRKNNINPSAFIDHYESNGWKVGRNSMKDWKATIRKWETNNHFGGSNETHQQIDNSAVGQIRRANAEREKRAADAQRQADGPDMAENGHDVRPSLEGELRGRG